MQGSVRLLRVCWELESSLCGQYMEFAVPRDKNAQQNKYVKCWGGGGVFEVFVGAFCPLVHLVCLAGSAEY